MSDFEFEIKIYGENFGKVRNTFKVKNTFTDMELDIPVYKNLNCGAAYLTDFKIISDIECKGIIQLEGDENKEIGISWWYFYFNSRSKEKTHIVELKDFKAEGYEFVENETDIVLEKAIKKYNVLKMKGIKDIKLLFTETELFYLCDGLPKEIKYNYSLKYQCEGENIVSNELEIIDASTDEFASRKLLEKLRVLLELEVVYEEKFIK